jgi:hypothetical protein
MTHVSCHDTTGAGAPGRRDEIEITPEMIEAGVREFLDFDSRYEHDFGELVSSIYEVMERAKEGGRHAAVLENEGPLLQR